MENLEVYVRPESMESSNVSVAVINRCALPVSLVRIWVNDDFISYNTTIPSMAERTLDPLELSAEVGESYDIRVTTDRGNVFMSENLFSSMVRVAGTWSSSR